MLDGGVHNDPFNNQALPLPFPDALQEFRVQTSAIPAQYGHHSAAAVNGVTKSGTNEFHGDLFEFLRDEHLNARNAFATQGDGLKRNQFGGTIGGTDRQRQALFLRRSPDDDSNARVPRRTSLLFRRQRCWPATSERSPRLRAP